MKRIATLLAVTAILAAFPLAAQAPAPEPAGSNRPKTEESDARVRGILEALERLKISGYIQAQFVDDESSRDELTASGSRNKDQFSIRRGRLKFVYTASPAARATVQLEANSNGVDLKDAFIELTEPWTEWKHTLTAGQFKWPFGFEIPYSSSSREMPERSRVIRTLFPGERDRGVMASGAGFGKRLTYQLAVVNGSGIDQSSDPDSSKDVVGRLGWSFPTLDVGASLYRGEALLATTAQPAGRMFDKNRTGVDAQWKTPLPGLTTRAEYVTGDEKGAEVDGWYVYLIQALGKKNELVVRADEYDANADLAGNAVFTLGGAWNYHLDKRTRVTLAYEHPEREEDDPDDDVL
ncbi:MAG TPA: porin, partial [Thermoanaerobaculia bacterium]